MLRNSSAPAPVTTRLGSPSQTHGGFGYAKEYHVERLYREVAVTRLAPITEAIDSELYRGEGPQPSQELLSQNEKE